MRAKSGEVEAVEVKRWALRMYVNGCFNPAMVDPNELPDPDSRTKYILESDVERIVVAKDAEIARLEHEMGELNADLRSYRFGLEQLRAQLAAQQAAVPDECAHEFVPFQPACVKCGEPYAAPAAPQVAVPVGFVLADKKALGEVLQALVNAPHHIRELQVTRIPVELFADNPINVLIANYETPAPKPVAYTTLGMLNLLPELPAPGRIGAKRDADERFNAPLYAAPAAPQQGVVMPKRKPIPDQMTFPGGLAY